MGMEDVIAGRWLQKQAGVQSKWVRGGDRQESISEVWAMYKSSYAKIGLTISGPEGLMKYDTWEVFFQDDIPVAFNLYKTTSFGMKTGLLGSDGAAGKPIIKQHIKG